MYFNIFGFFWTIALISAFLQVSIAGAIATWYFSRNANGHEPLKGSPALRSFGHALTKSFGSLAFGSLLVAIVEFLNFLVSSIQKTPTSNRVVQCLSCILRSILGCIQRLIKFVNRYAFISIAMHGQGFCASAKGSFDVISRNMFDAVIVDMLGEFVLLIGKLLGTALCTMFSLFLIHVVGREFSPATIVAVVIIAFVVFNLFANVVAVGVDTVLLCYLEDLERNGVGALYIDPTLHEKLQEKARQVRVNS